VRTEGSKRGLVFIFLAFALVFSMAIVATPVLAPAVISEPGGTIVEVLPGDEFMLRFRLRWDEAARGYYALSIDWLCPENRPEENFTFLSASAYFDNLDPIDNTVDLYKGGEGSGTRYNVVVGNATGDPRNGEFNVDVRFRAGGAGGVNHLPTNNHPMHLGTISVYETTLLDYAPPDPYITVRVHGRVVEVAILPDNQSGVPGATLEYIVTIKNAGAVEDNYDLSENDNLGWDLSLDNTRFENVQPGENRTTILSVTVPINAVPCTEDNIKVTATSQADSTVSDNDTCIAHAENVKPKVEVSISENYQSAPAGTTLSYAVTVKNTGNFVDNYILTVSDTENWGLSLDNTRFENVGPNQKRTTTLNVAIPGNAVPCTEDNITVTATSLTNNTVENYASTIAHAIIREVGITISPSFQRGGPDENIWGEYDLEYLVWVTNRSAQSDNYTLTVHDNLGWDLKLVGSLLLGVPAGENENIKLYVKVPKPEVAKPGTEDFIVVTATSQTDSTVSNYASCVAQSGVVAFEMSISPGQQSGIYLYELKYLVWVTNRGTLPDTYTLENYDNAGWDLRLPKPTRTVPAGENENWSLYVRVPFDAEPGTEDKITVVATSQTDNTLNKNASCIARAALVDMEVTISPSYQRGSPRENLVYLVTVKNTGDGVQPMGYLLTVGDNAEWGPTIDDNQLTLASGESATTKLRVLIPDDATHNTRDNLTVWVEASYLYQYPLEVYRESSAIAQTETLRLFISPGVDSARPGENLTFTVWVRNVGIEKDNYTLKVNDHAGWGPELSGNSFVDVPPSEWRLTTLSVAIPENATGGTEDNIMVTVIPGASSAASESENCVAITAPPGVRVSVSPQSQGESAGAKLSYAVIVRNFGTENDSYDLTFSDTQGWVDNTKFSENLLVVPGIGRRSAILEVAIPREAARGTTNNITVTATSRENEAVSSSASCTALVEPTVVKGDEMTSKAVIVRGDATVHNVDAGGEGDDPTEVFYSSGDYPPLMVARRVENGAVVAAGLVATCRDGRWKEPFDVLLDVAFRWMKPDNTAPIKVLWYGEYEVGVELDNENYYVENGVYNDASKGKCSLLIEALTAKGYMMEDTMDGEITMITSSLLENYDILVIPQLELPSQPFSNGGDPSLLPDNDVETIKNFVEGGGVLLIMDGTDYFGYNFYKVQNKILMGLGIDDVYFQSDQVNQDIVYAFNAEVMDVDFGADYRKETGLKQVWVYSACSLVVKPEKKDLNVSIEFVPPSYLEGLPGETLTYTLTITNTGKLDDAYILDVVDNAGFVSSVSPSKIVLSAGASDNSTLSVTIPESMSRGIESRITVSVTSVGDSTLGDVAYGEAWTGALDVSASIDPTSKSGRRGENLKFYAYITNTGDFDDNYTLGISDTAGWGPKLSLDNLIIPKGRTKFTVLSVIIPESAASGAEDNITVIVTSQIDNTVSAENSAKAHVAIVQGVNVSISPTTRSGAPGEELNFDVTVTNTGTGTDTFSLTASDTEGWDPILSITSTTLAGGASRTGIQLSVKIPVNAAEGESTTITVMASGTGYEDSASCAARATVIRGVEILISPASQSGYPEKTLTFTVTVKNTGEAEDTYELTVSDNAGWGAALAENLLTIPAGENQPTTVSVSVPSDAIKDESTVIEVIATSRSDPSASDTATCTAEARKKAPLPILPIGVGGAAIGGAIAVTLLLKKGTTSPSFLRSRQKGMFSRMNLNQSRPSKQSLFTTRSFRSNPRKERRFSKKWL